MIVVASANGSVGMSAAIEVLKAGGSALDAVEAGTRIVEENSADHSVGRGGYPNLLGQVELDASIMEGTTRRAGAIAALQGFLNPISIARAVMEHLPQHLLLTGEGAARFARERGFRAENLLTPEAEAAWRQKLRDIGVQTESGQVGELEMPLLPLLNIAHDPEKTAGTVNFLAQDHHGHIASAVSTSGWAFKYPGRVGDSPLLGSGNYCDDRWGACACTGLGEWSTRAGTARMVLAGMEFGLTLSQAGERAMHELTSLPLPRGVEPVMNLVAIDREGQHLGFATQGDRTYVWQTPAMERYETAPRKQVAG